MNIGYDAKRVFQNSSGLGNYSRTLISILSRYYPQHSYTLFAARPTRLFDLSVLPSAKLVSPKNFIDKKFPALWRRRLMVKDIASSGVNIFHGLSNELPAGIAGIPVKKLVTIHDIIYERFPDTYHFDERLVNRKKSRAACRDADIVIAISQQTKADLIEFYKIPEEKIRVCYQCCNPVFQQLIDPAALLESKKRYGLPDRFFLFNSSITKRKNLITICKAMVILKDRLGIPLVIIGKGKREKEESIQFMQKNGMANRLIFLNDLPGDKEGAFLSITDFPAIYQQATALIYPSVFEGFGLPVLEALWSGLPVISSNTSSLPEVGGGAAIYFSPMDEEALASHMITVAENIGIADEMRLKGIAQARKFDPEICAANIMKVYEELL